MEELLIRKLKENITVVEDNIEIKKYGAKGLTFLKLRDALITIGRIIEEDEEHKVYVAAIKAGLADMNTAYIAAGIEGDALELAVYAKEGLINQHTGDKAVEKLTNVLENKKKRSKVKPFVFLFLVAFIAVSVIFYMKSVKPAIAATKKYNAAVAYYNETIAEYNNKTSKTAVDNIKGFHSSVEKLFIVSENPVSIALSIAKGNRANKITADTATIYELVDSMKEEMPVMDQITNPSQDWVMGKLMRINSIKNCQAVTKNNDPNQSLGKEGGYKACIYFMLDQIDESKIEGNDAVAKGTDGGGAIEIYKNKKDAETRCEYLAGFDNTILYSGSYAIIGTMVVRTSYILTGEEQVDLTNKITKALTQK